ncbi:MAG: transketolase C-terminal domain-containing protein [Oligoflexia bacterium]|nr:transketolase C-terminal domain-containing protein [Oligoflexia bacterium]
MANMAQAIRMALHYGEENLGVKNIFGQDVGPPLGGVFTATQGLKTTWNTPLDERGIIGMAIGLAMAGSRCVAEIQFCDYIFNTIDLLKIGGNTCWATYGQFPIAMTVMTPVGSGIRGSLYHSHSFDSWATRLPGWKIVMPSNSLDAYGLLISAMKENNPVLFLKPKALLRVRGDELIPGEPENEKDLKNMIDAPLGDRSKWKPQWPKVTDFSVPIGQGKITRTGDHATVVSWGRLLPVCMQAAEELSSQGHSVEVIDLRSLYPYDWQMIKNSVMKTRRVIFVNEDTEISNFGEHLLRRTVEELFYHLDAKPRVIAGKHLPGIGLHPVLEDNSVPQLHHVIHELKELLTEVP